MLSLPSPASQRVGRRSQVRRTSFPPSAISLLQCVGRSSIARARAVTDDLGHFSRFYNAISRYHADPSYFGWGSGGLTTQSCFPSNMIELRPRYMLTCRAFQSLASPIPGGRISKSLSRGRRCAILKENGTHLITALLEDVLKALGASILLRFWQ